MRSHNAGILAGGFVLLLALGTSSPARASDGDTARARALFEAAGDLERDGRWSAAQDRLRTALRLRETPQLHFALGWALENDDKLIEAKSAYETAARMGRERPGGEEARRLALARLADLDTMTPIIRVRITNNSNKLPIRIVIDGTEIRSESAATTIVNPGSHVVRVECGPSGAKAIEHMVYVGRSAERTVDVDANEAVATSDTTQDGHVRRAAPVVRPTVTRDAAPEHTETFLPWLALSGGVAFALGGGALIVTAGEQDSGREVVGLALGGVGLVGATVGAMLLVQRTDSKRPRPAARAFGAAPLPSGGMATASFAF